MLPRQSTTEPNVSNTIALTVEVSVLIYITADMPRLEDLGLPIGDAGFINVSVEGTSAQPTNRGMEWAIQRGQTNGVNWQQGSFDVATYLAANPQFEYLFGSGADFDTANVQIWGQPEAEAIRGFVNAGTLEMG